MSSSDEGESKAAPAKRCCFSFQDVLYLPELRDKDLTAFDYIVVPTRLNQDILYEQREQFRSYLQQGGHLPDVEGEMPPESTCWVRLAFLLPRPMVFG